MNTIASTPSNGLLSIGKSAVAAQQQMLNTTSNNIANVGTEGYVRQRSQTYTSLLNYGVGETITERLNNTYSQQEVWRDTSISNYYDTVYGQLSSIDKYLSSESTGMSGAILDTLKSLQSAVNDPSSLAQRTEFIGSVNGLVNRFNTLYTDVNNTQQFNTSRIREDIGTVNEIIAKIANLNKAVQATLGEKSSVAYNLQDQRDAAIQELSKYMDIRTYNQKDGVILVTLSTGHSLVLQDGNHAVLEEVPGKFDYSNSQLNLTYKNSRWITPPSAVNLVVCLKFVLKLKRLKRVSDSLQSPWRMPLTRVITTVWILTEIWVVIFLPLPLLQLLDQIQKVWLQPQ